MCHQLPLRFRKSKPANNSAVKSNDENKNAGNENNGASVPSDKKFKITRQLYRTNPNKIVKIFIFLHPVHEDNFVLVGIFPLETLNAPFFFSTVC